MGCLFAKEQVGKPPRARVGATPGTPLLSRPEGAAPHSTSHGIYIKRGGSLAASVDSSAAFSKSLTNKRDEEGELIRRIVENTQLNFIDLTHKPLLLDDIDTRTRAERYRQQAPTLLLSSSASLAGSPLSCMSLRPAGSPSSPATGAAFDGGLAADALLAEGARTIIARLVTAARLLPAADHQMIHSAVNSVASAVSPLPLPDLTALALPVSEF